MEPDTKKILLDKLLIGVVIVGMATYYQTTYKHDLDRQDYLNNRRHTAVEALRDAFGVVIFELSKSSTRGNSDSSANSQAIDKLALTISKWGIYLSDSMRRNSISHGRLLRSVSSLGSPDSLRSLIASLHGQFEMACKAELGIAPKSKGSFELKWFSQQEIDTLKARDHVNSEYSRWKEWKEWKEWKQIQENQRRQNPE